MSNGGKKNTEKYSLPTAGLKICNGRRYQSYVLGIVPSVRFFFCTACPPVYKRVITGSVASGCNGHWTFGICIIRCPLVSTLQLSALYGRGQMLTFVDAQLASNPPFLSTFMSSMCALVRIPPPAAITKGRDQWYKFAPIESGTTQPNEFAIPNLWYLNCSSTKPLNWTTLKGKAALESKHVNTMTFPLTFSSLVV